MMANAMPDLTKRTDAEIDQWIKNHERQAATTAPLYMALLEERGRRSQQEGRLNLNRSLEILTEAARERRYVTYGDLAKASKAEWTKVRHKMNGAGGHLDLLLDICHARGLPLLPAICVNETGRQSGELEESALRGFSAGVRRIRPGAIGDDRALHHKIRDECFEWGANQPR